MLYDLTTWQWAGAAAAALMVGLSKAGFGAGAAILTVPLMAAVLTPAGMLPVTLLVLIAGDFLSLAYYPSTHDRRNLLMLLPGLLAGIGLGWLGLRWFLALPDSQLWMGRLIGALSVIFVAIQLHQMAREGASGASNKPYRPRFWHGLALGTAAGITSTLGHAGGQLVALFLLPQGLSRELYIGTGVKFFLVGNLAKLLPYYGTGLMTRQSLLTSLVLLPAVVIGAIAGYHLSRRFSDRGFRVAVYALALAFGIYLLGGWSATHRAGRPLPGGQRGAFEGALKAYDRGDYEEAGRVFGLLAAPGSPEPVLAVQAAFNGANCAFRLGQYDRAAQGYEAALRGARELLEKGSRRIGPAGMAALWEVLQRASFNLALAQCRAVRACAEQQIGPGAEPSGGGAQGGLSAPVEATAGASEGASPEPSGRSTSGALPGEGAPADRAIQEVLAGAIRGDTGPVLRRESPGYLPGGKGW